MKKIENMHIDKLSNYAKIVNKYSIAITAETLEQGGTEMTNVFIDGSSGTTGLRIHERLSQRMDIHLIELPEQLRKDAGACADAINSADIVFLCLPDDAAKEAVQMCKNANTVIIDTSTAHRVSDDWTYGFPELHGFHEKIAQSKRIANPGCHASGFIALVAPLVQSGLLKKDAMLSCFSLTGYSGGGKKTITEYEMPENKEMLLAPRLYSITQEHKHLAEMAKLSSLTCAPHFYPVVSSYYAGMETVVPVFADDLQGGIKDIEQFYAEYYTGKIVRWTPDSDENGYVSAGLFAGRDNMQISVLGNEERITLVSRFDNLGKGASGAAIQNMNIVLGLDETTGLNLEG